MKYHYYTLTQVIRESNATQFEQRFNEAMRQLACKSPTYKVYEAGDRFTALIFYQEEVTEAEDLREEYELNGGERLNCNQCPMFKSPTDRRKKDTECKFADYGITRADSICCDWLYEQLKQGTVTI